MTPHYILASKAMTKKEMSDARKWAEENGYGMFLERRLVTKALAEYNANKKGFTIHKHKATYPKEK